MLTIVYILYRRVTPIGITACMCVIKLKHKEEVLQFTILLSTYVFKYCLRLSLSITI